MRPRKQIITYKSWDELPLLLSLPEASILTGLGSERLRQLCVAGEIPGFKIGKKWRIEKSDLREWINQRKVVNIGA